MFNYNNIDNIQICMDVPFVDHPYLIGPRGRKCQHLMDRHKSLIHFPDSNRRQNGPKLNNVIINGSSKNAEELRFQIRSRTPIRLAVQLDKFSKAAGLCSRMENAIVERSLPIRFNYADDYSTAMLKTEWRNEDTLVAFCNEFFHSEFDYNMNVNQKNNNNKLELFTMALTILPVVNPWNSDLSHWIIEHIFDATGCRVFYPPKEKFADQPPSYFIKGDTAAGVLKAGKFMMGLTMFQVNFIVPNSVHLNLDKIESWQRELLVHTSIEPVFAGDCGTEFLHNRAVLRSFEFCLNSVYFVRSLLLGFKKTVQSSYYNFMSDVKRMIPYSVFANGQLYFPLYAIDDERSFNFETTHKDFFQKFYGGPYSSTTAVKQHTTSKTPVVLKPGGPVNANLTSRLKSLLNISGSDASQLSIATELSNEINEQKPKKSSVHDLSEVQSEDVSFEQVESARINSSNLDEKFSPNVRTEEKMPLSDSPPTVAMPASTSSTAVVKPAIFYQSTPVQTKAERLPPPPPPSSMIVINCCISATSPSNVDHEDDVEIQAMLRQAMPCLQVTQEQVKSMDHERISRALMTADSLAVFTNPLQDSFQHSDYAVSYPANVEAEEFERQFHEFVKLRNYKAKLKTKCDGGAGMKDVEELTSLQNNNNSVVIDLDSGKKRLRRSASF